MNFTAEELALIRSLLILEHEAIEAALEESVRDSRAVAHMVAELAIVKSALARIPD